MYLPEENAKNDSYRCRRNSFVFGMYVEVRQERDTDRPIGIIPSLAIPQRYIDTLLVFVSQMLGIKLTRHSLSNIIFTVYPMYMSRPYMFHSFVKWPSQNNKKLL